MNTIVVTSTKQNIKFGYEGEDNVTKIVFPYDESWLEYGEGNFEVRILRCGDEVAYTATDVVDDRQAMTLTMTVTDIELSVRGRGEMQLCYVCPDSIKKSPIYQYTVNRSVDYKYAVDPPEGSIIASVEKSLSEIKNTTNRLSNSVISIESSIDDVNSQIDNINDKISEFDEEIDSIGDVETRVDNLETSIQSINGRINTAEGNINENTESISDLNESVTELENRKVTDLETSGGRSDSGKYLTVGTDGKIKATSLTIPPTITVDASLSTTSTNPVQNKVIKTELNNINSNIETCNTEISKINGSLEAIDSAISTEKTVEVSWVNGYIKDNGTTAKDSKSCVTTTFVESTGRKIVVKTISGYRSKVAHYNSSQTFVEILYSISEDDKTIDIPAGDYIKIQVSSDSDLTPSDVVNNAIITVSEISYTATSVNKKVGISADSNDVYTLIGGMVNTNIYDEYTITSGYYSKTNGNEYSDDHYARCDKKSGFGGKTIHTVVGSNYQLTIRYWNVESYDNSKVSGYTQDGLFYVPTGYTIACNFRRVDGAAMDTADLTAIKASFRVYVVSAFENFVLDSGTDFNDVLDSGTYNVASSYITTYKNCPHNVSGSYGRLIVMSDANHYTCVQVYITYKNDIYTRILQLRDAGVWTEWTNAYNNAYIHDGEILRMTSTPEAIPVGSEHLGYTAFMAATWETLLPSGYTDGDAYNASTTKILNVHVSRESNWRSTAYGTNTDTYPIYRYTFTPIGGYKKTVFLSAGCHGNEAEGYWGLYRLIRMIYLEGYKYPTLRNLRDNVRFIIVPCWNPWGMQNYRRYNAFESNDLQAYRWFYATDNTITVDGTDYSINDVGEAKVIWDTIANYSAVIDLWLEIHTDPYAGRTTSAGEIDDPRGYTQPYGCYGFVKSNSRVHYRLQAVMEDFYNILLGEYNFTEKWHLVSSNGDASGAGGYSPWMASLSFPTALVEISTFMNGFPHASGSAGMMKLAQEYYANCLAELIR